MELGKLEKVDLRTVWEKEPSDFTEWLSKTENLSKLSDELGFGLTLVQKEADVGDFNVDILAQDEDRQRVIIENQLETSNHDHLGKLITYAAGRDAKKIVWIVNDFRDEHKQAIDWLNEHIQDEIQFYAIRMEAYRIGKSLPAPKFQLVSTPNTWTRTIRTSTARGEPTKMKLLQLDFWKRFKEFAESDGTRLVLRSPRAQQWYSIGIGSRKAHLDLRVNTQRNSMGCEINVHEDKSLFKALQRKRKSIERVVGEKLDWDLKEGRKASMVRLSRRADLRDDSKWDGYFKWLNEKAGVFQRVFSREIKATA